MTWDEWGPIARRISRLWPPAMEVPIAEEYHAVLEVFPAWAVAKAVELAAKAPRNYRPDVGTLYVTAEAQVKARQEALPPPEIDPLSAEEHEAVLAEEAHRQTAEHRRRHEAVVDLMRSTGYRVPLAELPALMATSQTEPEAFDRRMTFHRSAAAAARMAS